MAMPTTKVITAATIQIKTSAGYVDALSCSSAGTAFTLQIFDGPDQNNADIPVYGGTTAGTITTGIVIIAPIYCSKGIKIVTGGTPGELDVQWH
jgi:hypothetical protein